MVRLEDLIGKRVTIAIRQSIESVYEVTLHGVEAGGLWVESREMQRLLGDIPKGSKNRRARPSEKPVFFIPYAQIVLLVASSTELDETSFEE